MSFAVSPEAYGRFMGRYSEPLAPLLADLADVAAPQRVLDVGCGPGALTAELVRRLGASAVSAVDPSEPFVAGLARRLPGVDVRLAPAEVLPYGDSTFDAALAQLVVQFMADPVRGLTEMARVTRPGGVVAASVWDHRGGRGPLSLFWDAARSLDPSVTDESGVAGSSDGQLADLFASAGLRAVESTALSVTVRHPTFEEWWQPFGLGVGPAGEHVRRLDAKGAARLERRCRELLPALPFDVTVVAWAARATTVTLPAARR